MDSDLQFQSSTNNTQWVEDPQQFPILGKNLNYYSQSKTTIKTENSEDSIKSSLKSQKKDDKFRSEQKKFYQSIQSHQQSWRQYIKYFDKYLNQLRKSYYQDSYNTRDINEKVVFASTIIKDIIKRRAQQVCRFMKMDKLMKKAKFLLIREELAVIRALKRMYRINVDQQFMDTLR